MLYVKILDRIDGLLVDYLVFLKENVVFFKILNMKNK